MILVKCRSCGRQYDYAKDDCCPRCGAYNRPPRHERVDADGTVHHLTDAEYAARGHAVTEKVCFEEKTCFEDEARPKASRRKRAANPAVNPAEQSKKTGLVIALLLAVILPCAAVIVRNAASEPQIEEPLYDFGEMVVTEPDDAYHVTLDTFEAEDGSVFTLLGWRRADDEIVIDLDVEFADTDHEFYASLDCVDAEGNVVTLTGFTTDESGGSIVSLCFAAEDDTPLPLFPLTFTVEEWGDGDAPVSLWEAAL
ncbi:MAG: hypothetical protein IJQ65_00260 [Kiritimatiellae bacterium]|nr:hypothetical protein [Kiritimatiellia bacterium]